MESNGVRPSPSACHAMCIADNVVFRFDHYAKIQPFAREFGYRSRELQLDLELCFDPIVFAGPYVAMSYG